MKIVSEIFYGFGNYCYICSVNLKNNVYGSTVLKDDRRCSGNRGTQGHDNIRGLGFSKLAGEYTPTCFLKNKKIIIEESTEGII